MTLRRVCLGVLVQLLWAAPMFPVGTPVVIKPPPPANSTEGPTTHQLWRIASPRTYIHSTVGGADYQDARRPLASENACRQVLLLMWPRHYVSATTEAIESKCVCLSHQSGAGGYECLRECKEHGTPYKSNLMTGGLGSTKSTPTTVVCRRKELRLVGCGMDSSLVSDPFFCLSSLAPNKLPYPPCGSYARLLNKQ